MTGSGDKPQWMRVRVLASDLVALRNAFLSRLPAGVTIRDSELLTGALRFTEKFARRDSAIRKRLDRMAFDCATEAAQLVLDSLLGKGKAKAEITPETGAVIVVFPDGERKELDAVSEASRDLSTFFGGVV